VLNKLSTWTILPNISKLGIEKVYIVQFGIKVYKYVVEPGGLLGNLVPEAINSHRKTSPEGFRSRKCILELIVCGCGNM
jgi:hypothetical protein